MRAKVGEGTYTDFNNGNEVNHELKDQQGLDGMATNHRTIRELLQDAGQEATGDNYEYFADFFHLL